jgi:hypothetical protein
MPWHVIMLLVKTAVSTLFNGDQHLGHLFNHVVGPFVISLLFLRLSLPSFFLPYRFLCPTPPPSSHGGRLLPWGSRQGELQPRANPLADQLRGNCARVTRGKEPSRSSYLVRNVIVFESIAPCVPPPPRPHKPPGDPLSATRQKGKPAVVRSATVRGMATGLACGTCASCLLPGPGSALASSMLECPCSAGIRVTTRKRRCQMHRAWHRYHDHHGGTPVCLHVPDKNNF